MHDAEADFRTSADETFACVRLRPQDCPVAGIALLLLDLNGVLYRYDRDARIAVLAARSGRSAEAIRVAIWDSGFEDAGDAGQFDAAAYLRGFGTCMGYDLTEAESRLSAN
jgi:hypothetical protein